MLENLQANALAIVAFLAVGGGLYVAPSAKGAVAKVRAMFSRATPGPEPATPAADLEAVLATIRAVKMRALDKPANVRTVCLAECDKFESTVRGVFAEATA